MQAAKVDNLVFKEGEISKVLIQLAKVNVLCKR